ncbi:uncharacterized protein [Apostichopus japonicus]|uniref:uncharacterized protein n=1 Tax=Stichopus japonicus TaxID=307972 RepID=UPI003AB88621
MPLNCIVGGCTTTWSSSNKHISFFRFPSPKTDSERYRIWLRFVQRTRSDFEGPGISHGEGSRLCSLHFLESDCEDSYILKKRLLPSQNERLLPTLKKNAVPTLLPRKGRLKKNKRWKVVLKPSSDFEECDGGPIIVENASGAVEQLVSFALSRRLSENNVETSTPGDRGAAEQLVNLTNSRGGPEDAEPETASKIPAVDGSDTTGKSTMSEDDVRFYLDALMTRYQENGTSVRSKIWNKSVGTQTTFECKETKNAWTQYEMISETDRGKSTHLNDLVQRLMERKQADQRQKALQKRRRKRENQRKKRLQKRKAKS